VVLGLHRKPLQLALACCGAVVFVAAVTSPLLWRKEVVPEAPARTVAQQIVPPAAPPAAPAMPAIPAAPPAKAEPPPLPVTAEIGRPLSRTQVIQLQGQLKALGFDPGPADGIVGPRTVTAARAFQAANGQAVTGLIDSRLFDAVAAASSRITSR
jgi:peptidoglycan hydrolase-like protein with peptidoglycan-binding domain